MKKYILCLCLFLVLGLCSCKTDPTPDGPNTPEPTLTKIQVVDELGADLTEVSEYQSTDIYRHNGVHVLAHYSDENTIDVTAFASFSEVDMTKIGQQTVEVTYNNLKDTYVLIILENSVTSISLQTDNVKIVYKIGERYSSTGLVVRARYTDGKTELTSNYQVSITDEANQSISYTQPFVDSGRFDVLVKVGKASSFYQIVVYKDEYSSSDSLDLTAYAKGLELDDEGNYTFSEETDLLKESESVKLEATSTRIASKNGGKDISISYAGKSYTRALSVGTELDLKLALFEAAEIVLIASGTGHNLVFRDDSTDFTTFGNLAEDCSFLYIYLEAGTYDVIASIDTVLIYDIMIGYTNEESVKLTGIEIDKSQDLKTVYNLNDSIDLSNLPVLAYYSDETSKFIPSYELIVTLIHEEKEYQTLEVEGTFEIVVQYGRFTDRFQIQVIDIRTYDKLAVDTNNAVLTFTEKPFHTDGLKVYIVKSDQTKELVDSSQYDVILIFEDHIVTDFITSGTYEVRIAYKGLHTITTSNYISYNVTYEPNN